MNRKTAAAAINNKYKELISKQMQEEDKAMITVQPQKMDAEGKPEIGPKQLNLDYKTFAQMKYPITLPIVYAQFGNAIGVNRI